MELGNVEAEQVWVGLPRIFPNSETLLHGDAMKRKTNLFSIALVAFSMLMQNALAVEVSKSSKRLGAEKSAGGTNVPHPPKTSEEQPKSRGFLLGSRFFSIPFSIDEAGLKPAEVRLYVALGSDQPWSLYDSQTLSNSKQKFEFEAKSDGEYWFSTRTIDENGLEYPGTPIEPQLKVVIDTTKPKISLRAEAEADGVISVEYSVEDDSDLTAFKLRYATDSSPEWIAAEVDLAGPLGGLSFQPDGSSDWQQVSVELSVTDAAGNVAQQTRQVRRPRLAAAVKASVVDFNQTKGDQSMLVPLRLEQKTAVISGQAPERVLAEDKSDELKAEIPESSNDPTQSDWNTITDLVEGESDLTRQDKARLLEANAGQTTAGEVKSIESTALIGQSFVNAESLDPNSTGAAVADSPLISIAQLGNQPRRPISLFEKLFGASSQSEFPPRQTYSNSLTVPATPPSLLGGNAVPSRLTAGPKDLLPPPASPAEISEGFQLNGPAQSPSFQVMKQQTSGISNSGEIVPETAPVLLGGNGAAANQQTPSDRRPETPAEAMRPIEESSSVLPLLQQTEVASNEENSTDVAEDQPAYESNRNSLDDTGIRTDSMEAMMARLPVRFSKGKRFSLDYELEAVGMQGAESIELYGTTNGGQSWELWGSDPDRQTPFDIETQEAGIFGFRICVVGRNGLASPRPLPGESPDIVIVVDTDIPEVRITGARYGEGSRVGSLIISYQCDDKNLPSRPITIAFSESLQGPWTTIAAGLRNEGQYIWAADPNLPRQLYLRIDATDEAGNHGFYLLDQPINTQGLAPRAKIRGFKPLSSNESLTPENAGVTAGLNRDQF